MNNFYNAVLRKTLLRQVMVKVRRLVSEKKMYKIDHSC